MLVMKFLKKTVNCGVLNSSFCGKNVVVDGWVDRKRELGAINFVNVRDRSGIVQVYISENADDKIKKTVSKLRNEFCIAVKGEVRLREGAKNPDMSTGDIEIVCSQIEILNECEVLPFQIESGKTNAKEDFWDGMDDGGRPCTMGIYYVRVKDNHGHIGWGKVMSLGGGR